MVCVVFERTITQFGKEASDFVNVTGGVLQSSKLGKIAFVIKIYMLPSVIEQVVAQGVNDDVVVDENTLAKIDTILSLYFLYFTSYLIPIEKLFYFQPYHIAITYTNPILNISEHCFNATLSL